jgi:hypothetical protein
MAEEGHFRIYLRIYLTTKYTKEAQRAQSQNHRGSPLRPLR